MAKRSSGWAGCLRYACALFFGVQIASAELPFLYKVEPPETGSVTISLPWPEGGEYPPGQMVTITATPAAGYHFLSWSIPVGEEIITQFSPVYHGPIPTDLLTARFRPDSIRFSQARELQGMNVEESEYLYELGAWVGDGEPRRGVGVQAPGLWWSWVAPESGLVEFTASSYPGGGLVAPMVFRGSDLQRLMQITRYGEHRFEAEAGQEYHIVTDDAYATPLSGWREGWISLRQPDVRPIPLQPAFQLDHSAPGFSFRYLQGGYTVNSAGQAALMIQGKAKPRSSYEHNLFEGLTARGLRASSTFVGDQQVDNASVVEMTGFMDLPAGEHTFAFQGERFELYAGANYALVARGKENQWETCVTFASTGGVYPFRLRTWGEVVWNWIDPENGEKVPLDVSEKGPAISRATLPGASAFRFLPTSYSTSEGSTPLMFQLLREGNLESEIMVRLEYIGTATRDEDFTGLSPILFSPGENYGPFWVGVFEDQLEEGIESANLVLRTEGDYLLGGETTARLSIYDKASHPPGTPPPQGSSPLPQVSIVSPSSGAIIDEGDAVRFEIDASDRTGIHHVELFYSSEENQARVWAGNSAAAPYVVERHLMPRGKYWFTAAAVNNQRWRAESSPVEITVRPQQIALEFPGLLHWWRGEDNTFDARGDAHGQALFRADYGTGWFGQAFNTYAGEFRFPLQFDPSHGFTLSAWVETDSGTVLSIYRLQPGRPLAARLRLGPVPFFTLVGHLGGTASTPIPSGQYHNLSGTWRHLAGTYDGAALHLYLDGVLRGKTAFAGPFANSPAELVLESVRTLDFATVHPTLLGGLVDEIKLYNRALSATEIASDFHGIRLPDNIMVMKGRAVTLRAEPFREEPLQWSWYREGTWISTNKEPWMTFPEISERDAGAYQLRVKRGEEWLTMPTFSVSVVELEIDERGARRLSIHGPKNAVYDLEFTPALGSPWTRLAELRLQTQGHANYLHIQRTSAGYYRFIQK